MHAKGVTPEMINIAAATGMPVKLGAKYAAEHASLGYNQADIRALEIPDPKRVVSKDMAVSAGTRLFTRYGYGDFYQDGAKYKILYRLWPGTQRHLLSADPETAAAYGRTSSFCGAAGLDICEPLAFKGRMGSGLAGGRCAYADESLTPKADWQKFELFYRVWGRKLYDPEASPESWRRYLKSEFGAAAAESVETAVANASRVNPLVTSAHLTSASNNVYWPEMYTNQPIVLTDAPSPYWDTPDPKVFGTVSPLDPQIFATIVECAQNLLAGQPSAKYSPIEVAQWLEDYTTTSTRALADACARRRSLRDPSAERQCRSRPAGTCAIQESARLLGGNGRARQTHLPRRHHLWSHAAPSWPLDRSPASHRQRPCRNEPEARHTVRSKHQRRSLFVRHSSRHGQAEPPVRHLQAHVP